MTTDNTVTPPRAAGAYEPLSPAEKLEEEAAYATLAAGEALRAAEIVAIVFLGLLLCPPLLILAVVTVVPVLALALVVGVLVAVLSAPYLLIHHLRSPDRRHQHLLGHRLRHAGRALADLSPHRIVADARDRHHADR